VAAPKTAKAKASEAEGSDELPAVLAREAGPVADPKTYRVLSPVQVSGRRRFEAGAILDCGTVSDEEAAGLVKLGALEEVAP
jgi:hypothetical protein